MREPELKAQFARMYDRAINHLDFDLTRRLCTADAEFKTSTGVIRGTGEIIRLIELQHASFDAFHLEVTFIFAHDSGLGVSWVATGRHVAEFAGVPPSGEIVRIQGISIHKLVDRRSVGGWVCSSTIDALERALRAAQSACH